MCGPFGALLATGLAGFVKYKGEQKAAKARERTFNSERARQEALTGQQTAKFQDSLDRTKELFDPAKRDAAAGARESALVEAIKPAGGSIGSYLPGSSSAPSLVRTAADTSQAASRETSLNLAKAIAALGGTGDQLQEINTQIGRNSQSIGQLASFKGGSVGVLDSELQAASQKGAFLRGAGGLAQQVGMAYLTGGAGGAAGAGLSYPGGGTPLPGSAPMFNPYGRTPT